MKSLCRLKSFEVISQKEALKNAGISSSALQDHLLILQRLVLPLHVLALPLRP